MTLATYSPATWLDQFFNDFDKAAGVSKRSFNPPVDIVEDKEEFVLRAELPGVAKENLKVEVKENRLTVSGRKESAWEKKSGEYRYAEASYGEFARSFELPRNVQGGDIRAEYANGVLTLRIPKAKEACPGPSRSIKHPPVGGMGGGPEGPPFFVRGSRGP